MWQNSAHLCISEQIRPVLLAPAAHFCMQFHPDLCWLDYANEERDSSEPFTGPLIGSAATPLFHFYSPVSFLSTLRACLAVQRRFHFSSRANSLNFAI